MQKADTNNISVTISRFGHEPKTVSVPEGSTVSQVLELANITLEGREELFVEGVSAEGVDVLENNDILSVVTPKQAG